MSPARSAGGAEPIGQIRTALNRRAHARRPIPHRLLGSRDDGGWGGIAAAPARPPSSCSSEEAAQFLRGLFRNFLGKEMTGIEGSATDIVCPGTPQRKRTAALCVATVQRT